MDVPACLTRTTPCPLAGCRGFLVRSFLFQFVSIAIIMPGPQSRLAASPFHRLLATLPICAASFTGCSSRNSEFSVTPVHQELGIVEENGIAIGSFYLNNFLSKDVAITEISPSCKCTSVKIDRNPVPAGQSVRLLASADINGYSGQQDFTVFIRTDSVSYPHFTLSFSVLVPATGKRERRFAIGNYTAGQKMRYAIPVESFATGEIDLISSNSSDFKCVATVEGSRDLQILVLDGTTPDEIGRFECDVIFREWFPQNEALGEGHVSLRLNGSVVPRWDVPDDIYLGMIDFADKTGRSDKKCVFNRSRQDGDSVRLVTQVKCDFNVPWASVQDLQFSRERISLVIGASKDHVSAEGPQQASAVVRVTYDDASVEEYRSTIYAFFTNAVP